MELSEAAAAALKDHGARIRATSSIVASTFDDWTRRHPDWRVIPQADEFQNEAMIEVPSVTVAGYEVGPVWFTRRADKNFHEFMSRFIDRTIEGALGGNVLRSFRMTVDYPGAAAYFEKPVSPRRARARYSRSPSRQMNPQPPPISLTASRSSFSPFFRGR